MKEPNPAPEYTAAQLLEEQQLTLGTYAGGYWDPDRKVWTGGHWELPYGGAPLPGHLVRAALRQLRPGNMDLFVLSELFTALDTIAASPMSPVTDFLRLLAGVVRQEYSDTFLARESRDG